MFLLPIIAGCCSAFILSFVLNRLTLIPWRKTADRHWTERARVLYPARCSSSVNTLLIPANIVVVQLLFHPALSACWGTLFLFNFLCALAGSFWFQKDIFPGLTWGCWLSQIIIGALLRWGLMFAYVICAIAMPDHFGWQTWAVIIGLLLFHCALLSGRRLKWMLRLGLALPPDERLQRIVSETSARLDVPDVRVWRITGMWAQAYALPVSRELLFSTSLLKACDDREIASICAHELGHLTEPKAVLFRRIAVTFAFLPLLFMQPMIAATGPLALVLPAGTLLLLLLVRKLSIRMEQRADTIAAADQLEAGVYGRALEKIYRENQIPAVTSGRHPTHPHLYDRLQSAGITPDYPRPKPAKKYQWSTFVLYVWLIISVLVYLNLFCTPNPPFPVQWQ